MTAWGRSGRRSRPVGYGRRRGGEQRRTLVRRKWSTVSAAVCAVGALAVVGGTSAAANDGHGHDGRIKHIVVVYQENHSLDNLYGTWGAVNGDTVEGVAQAPLGHA